MGHAGRFVLIAAALVVLVGCQVPHQTHDKRPATTKKPSEPATPKRPEGVIGYYVHDDPAFYSTKDMASVPPGQVLYLGIESGRWMMRNMLTGHGGTWSIVEGQTIMIVEEGPTGKASGEETFSVLRTETGVELSMPGNEQMSLRFRYLGPSAPPDFGFDKLLGMDKKAKP